jgi:hypothetical protein
VLTHCIINKSYQSSDVFNELGHSLVVGDEKTLEIFVEVVVYKLLL